MSETVSSVSSVSLLEIKADTRLVLKAFLHQTLSVPPVERAGRVGGAYRDHKKYSAGPKPKSKQKNEWDSQDDDVSSADEKRNSLKSLIKRIPRPNTMRRSAKYPDPDLKDKRSSDKDGRTDGLSSGSSLLREQHEGDVRIPSSTSEEEDCDQKQKKRNRFKISSIFKKKTEEKAKDRISHPKRPTSLSINTGPETTPVLTSPNHSPDFYKEVAEKLGKIAKRSHSIKRTSPSRQPSPAKPPPACDKEEVVQQLVKLLCMEGDAINAKIKADPFLRGTLTRLSYPSFAKLLDAVGTQEVAMQSPSPAMASPMLRRVAVTMEVSRRVVTATGTQRMTGYAERYMETFAPWVKSHGGWENIADLEDVLEYD